jgi:hypothetical protein
VQSRQLRWNGRAERGDQAEAAFPTDAVATPPLVARAAGRDWYVWLNRGSSHTTGFSVLTLLAAKEEESAEFHKLPCPQRKPIADIAECDFDSSVVRMAQASDATEGSVGFFALTHRFADKTEGANKYEPGTIGLHRWNMPLAAFEGKDALEPATFTSRLKTLRMNASPFSGAPSGPSSRFAP